MRSAAANFIALAVLFACGCVAEETPSAVVDGNVAGCDRKLKKTVEALQAWRRLHDGRYPDRLADLRAAGLLGVNGGICPRILEEQPGADPRHGLASSQRDGGDLPGAYEYELATGVAAQHRVLTDGVWVEKAYTRQDLKAELLRREFWEQVPLLRCRGHKTSGRGANETVRNATASGKVYWSGELWEMNWLADVPYCCRDRNILFGLKGPPFHSGRKPELGKALDLRAWICAFGDHPWWWTFPMFGPNENQSTPALKPFFQEKHGRRMELDGEEWWIDGLVQLQGRISNDPAEAYRAPSLQTFVWEKKALPIARSIRKTSWIQGTVWTARDGEVVGWLDWHYRDGGSERVPIVYGETTRRFWADRPQMDAESATPSEVWRHNELAESVGQERWLRLYRQSWINPAPDRELILLDFISNPASPAAPFIIAINVD